MRGDVVFCDRFLQTLRQPLVFLYNGLNHKLHSANAYVSSPLHGEVDMPESWCVACRQRTRSRSIPQIPTCQMMGCILPPQGAPIRITTLFPRVSISPYAASATNLDILDTLDIDTEVSQYMEEEPVAPFDRVEKT